MNTPRSPRNSVKDSLVVAFMELLAQRPLEDITTTVICVRAGVHRTSFYRYFEDVDDLESQFLNLYLQKAFRGMWRFPRSAEELAALYEDLIRALVVQQDFFAQSMKEPRLLKYSNGLKSLIEEWLRWQFSGRVKIVDPDLWELNLQFALGTVFRLCEIVFRSPTDLSIRSMTRWMLEFLWGGRDFLVRVQNSVGTPELSALDRRLRELSGDPAVAVS